MYKTNNYDQIFKQKKYQISVFTDFNIHLSSQKRFFYKKSMIFLCF